MGLANIGTDRFLGKLLRLPLRLLPGRTVLSVRTGINKGYRWRVGSSIHGCWLGTYEADKQATLSQLARPGMIAWDIGANAGFYSLALARLVGSRGRVHAFEPLAENAANILDHLRLNRCDNVALYQLAVSDRNGLAPFHVAESNAMGHLSESGAYRVPTAAMDELVWGQGLPAPDIVKMDVEGAESLVLQGAAKLLGLRQTVWFIALHGAEQRDKVGRMLAANGYTVYRLDGSKPAGGAIDTDEIYALPGEATGGTA